MTVSLESMKAHLNVTTDDDDALIADKLATASEWIALYTGIPADADDIPAPVNEGIPPACGAPLRESGGVSNRRNGAISAVWPLGFA